MCQVAYLLYVICMADYHASFCSRFHRAVELIGLRWAGAIIQVLLRGRARYGAIRAAIPDINDRMLCERLKELEAEGIVARHVMPETPPRVDYELTAKGRALEAAIGEISRWAEQWSQLDSAANTGAKTSVKRRAHAREARSATGRKRA